jgi:cytochrome c553
MSKLAKTLSLEERINIAVYYSQQTAKPRTGGDPTKAGASEKLFAVRCAGCHGDKAQGFRDMPRLAGQPAEYLGIALRRFKEMDPTKHSTPMIGVANSLSSGDIDSLSNYLASK